jgi:Txe/YoeB family toxin of Txe-Axe toxin-antitoxin module
VKNPSGQPWRIQFFRRHKDDDPLEACPTAVFLDSLPTKTVAEIQAVLEAVAAAPPPSFSGGGKWEAMHGDLSGLYEVRVASAGMNHRVFCILDRDGLGFGGASIVAIDGLSKPKRSAASPRDYRRVLRMREEFLLRRTVL